MAAMSPKLKSSIRAARWEVHAIYLTLRDRRVPWHVKALAICVVAFALSPIDLLPDFIPAVGYADDWIVVTLGTLAIVQLVPLEIIAEHKAAAMAANRESLEKT
jgi:uncharacterized membrane protein YkvA (DUF1232 family)